MYLLVGFFLSFKCISSQTNKCDIITNDSGKPSDARLLSGFNDVLGPIINLTYYDKGLILGTQNIRVGALRHPGGTVANYWSMQNASYVQPCNTSNYNYCKWQARVAALPEQTFSPGNFTGGVGGKSALNTSFSNANTVVFDLNLLTLTQAEMLNQIDVLKFEIDEDILKYMELGNEYYLNSYAWKFPNSTVYMETALPLINHIRTELPNAKIAAITQKAFPGANNKFNDGVAGYNNYFDAVTIHDYSCGANTVKNMKLSQQIGVFSIYGNSVIPQYCEYVSKQFGSDKKIWMTEFNSGLGNNAWNHTTSFQAVHGMFGLSYINGAVCNSNTMEILMMHLISTEEGTGWGTYQDLMYNSQYKDDVNNAQYNIVGQIYSHFNYISMDKNNQMFCLKTDNNCPDLDVHVAGKTLSCLNGMGFNNKYDDNMFGFSLINSCNFTITVTYNLNNFVSLKNDVTLGYWEYIWNQYNNGTKFMECNGKQLWECGNAQPNYKTLSIKQSQSTFNFNINSLSLILAVIL